MKNLNDIKTRFLKDPFNIKIGNLAAGLARLSSFSKNPKNREAVRDILEESKFFIEWIAPGAPLEVQTLLSEIQPKLALWQFHLVHEKKDPEEMNELRKMAKSWSAHLIKSSGLIA